MEKIKLYFQNFLSYFVLFFCFFLFPIFLFYTSLDIVLESKVNSLRQSTLEEMDNSLEYLNKYSNNKKYFHYLLSKISDYSQDASDPLEYFTININNIKAKYPNKFQFVVWNEKGEIIKRLTDKSSYSYVLNKLYESLYEVTNAVKDNSSTKISNLSLIKKNISFLQSFFGRIFVPEKLKKPIINDYNSGPLLTELGHDFSYVWFSMKPKVSFLCFISESLLNEYSGLNKIVNSLNSNESRIIYGFSKIPNYDEPISEFPVKYQSNLCLALATFENGGNDIFENSESIVRMSMPQPNIRAFCFLPKIDDIWNHDYQKKYWFGIFICVLLMIYSFIGFWYLYKQNFFSIRWKLTILFLLANLAPISILGFVTKFYIDHKRISLINDITGNIEKNIREIDIQYNNFILSYSSKLNSIVDEISKKINNNEVNQAQIQQLSSLYDEFEASSAFLIASDSNIILYRHDKKNLMSKEFMAGIGRAILLYFNNIEISVKKGDIFSTIYDPETSGFLRTIIKSIGKISNMLVGGKSKEYYCRTFGDKEKYNNNYVFMLLWDIDAFQNISLKSYLKNNYKESNKYDFFIRSKHSRFTYGSKKLERVLGSILAKNPEKMDNITGEVLIDNKKYVFAYLTGVKFKDWSIIGVYPEEEIDKEINLLLIQIIAVAFISLLFTIIIGHILSIQFLNPIKNLGVATLAIGDRNFSHRIPIVDKDEFGYLNQIFNRVIEGLGDFEVGKIVQESLFPGNHFNIGNYDIFGRSVVMTTLGGDYYDCFKINDDYQGIIIGDVSGHGIPAGLMMAMAKSSVLSAPEEVKLDPTALTTRLHKMFYAVNNERLKRMMTFQYFVLNIKTGHFICTNAGHCFPVKVDNNSKSAEYFEFIANPLGVGKRCRCKNYEFDLKDGESLVLYTDGIVEAYNEAGEQFGYERFKDSLLKYYDSNSENYYYNIYNKVYKEWTNKADDDLTIIIVNRNE